MPGDGQAVAAVVALAADDGDALAVERRQAFLQYFHDAQGGVLHEDDAGDVIVFDCLPVHLPHLGGGGDFHKGTFSGAMKPPAGKGNLCFAQKMRSPLFCPKDICSS